jgi:integrase
MFGKHGENGMTSTTTAAARKPLTDATIRNAKPAEKAYRLRDGHGLSLEVTPAGGKLWRYRFELHGREHLYALGQWATAPDGETAEQSATRRAAGRFTLAEARIERQRCRDLVKLGRHPLHVKKAEQQERTRAAANTFEAIAREFAGKQGHWTGTHRFRFESFMQRDVFPALGSLPIRDVNAPAILAVLRVVEERGSTDMAGMGRGFIGQVFRYAIANGISDSDPTLAMRGALRPHKKKHHEPLARADFPAFFNALGSIPLDRVTDIAVRLLAYLFVRPGELRKARWEEVNLDAGEWRIPGKRMKKRTVTDHVVPLPAQAVALLRELRALTGHTPWLFPHSRRPRDCMAEGTLGQTIERVLAAIGDGKDRRFSPHSWRATASTILHESGVESRLIELQLAHADRDDSRASYDRSARLAERAAMMQSYADLIDRLIAGESAAASNVVPLRGAGPAAA